MIKQLFLYVGVSMLFLCCTQTNEEVEVTVPKVKSDKPIEFIQISNLPGDNILPFYNDTLNFIGFPCFIGKTDDAVAKVFFVFGKNIGIRKRMDVHSIAKFDYRVNNKNRTIYVSYPEQEKFQSWVLGPDEDFNLDKSSLKLWIQDWIVNAYKGKRVEFHAWNSITPQY